MNGPQAIAIFGLISVVFGVWGLIWAVKTGQLRGSDPGRIPLADDKGSPQERVDRSGTPLAKFTIGIIVAAFVFIALAITITLFSATHAADDAAAHHADMPF